LDNCKLISLSPKGVLEYTKEDSSEYYNKSKDVFFGISTNSWLFWVLISDSESPEREDSEYIGIFWISCVGWLWEKKETFFFFSAGVEIEGFWDKEDESGRSKKIESFRFNLLRSYWIYRAIASEDKDI
jgi:hypothetical protein